MKCGYCQQNFYYNWSIEELFLYRKIRKPTMCLSCQEKFEKLPIKGICLGCHKISSEDYCLDCQEWQKLYPDYHFQHHSIYQYNEGMHDWFQQYKFKGDFNLRSCFQNELRCYFLKYPKACIVPIPLSVERLKERGFNQVTGLLQGGNISYVELLEKNKENVPQSKKNRKERLETRQPFCVKTDLAKELSLEKQEIILVDDIYTTGRTLFHAASLIREYQPKSIHTFSLAR